MKKKIISIILANDVLFTITSCVNKKEYTATFNANGGKVNGSEYYEIKFKENAGLLEFPVATRAGYRFVGWYLDGELITAIDKTANTDVELKAEWEEYTFTTPVTDRVKLTADYEGKDYYEDGIGVVTVQQFVDGDTTIFKSGSRTITIRYIGIDTPESTYKVDPWGYSASNYTKEVLKNAKTIVLQTDNGKPGKDPENVDTTGNRHLAWVWADGRLLNLQIVEVGLANSKASATTYDSEFIDAIKPLIAAKVRIYGQDDPDYDYSKDYIDMNLKEVHEKYGTPEAILDKKDAGKKIRVHGVVSRKIGSGSAFLQQTLDGQTYGIYLYGGYTENNKLQQGYSVIVSGTVGYYNGCLQISSVTSAKIKIQSYYAQEEIKINEVSNIKDYVANQQNIGNILKITTSLTIVDYYDAKNEKSNAITLYASYTDENNQTQKIQIRIDNNVTLRDDEGQRIDTGAYFVGKTFKSLTCIMGYYDPSDNNVYDGTVQMMITQMKDIEFVD